MHVDTNKFYNNFNRVRVIVFNATFNNIPVISWWSVLFAEEIKYLEKTNNFEKYRILCCFNIRFIQYT